jgi:hypothetical protein
MAACCERTNLFFLCRDIQTDPTRKAALAELIELVHDNALANFRVVLKIAVNVPWGLPYGAANGIIYGMDMGYGEFVTRQTQILVKLGLLPLVCDTTAAMVDLQRWVADS